MTQENQILLSKIDKSTVGRLELCKLIGMAYGTFGAKINGYAPFTTEELKKINDILEDS